MMRKSNKGISMVEVLIALAIFLILLMPLVQSLITGMKTTTSAKELQYRNEYVRNLMENVKEVPISVLKDATAAQDYFESLGAENVTMTSTLATNTKSDGTLSVNPFDKYIISGTTNLGVENTRYSYRIEVSGEDYAVAQETEANFIDPNSLTAGVVEDIDQSKVAFISAPFANYDYPAFDSLLTQKMDEIRKRHINNGTNYDAAEDIKKFANDTGRREVIIAVSGGVATGYTVKCTVKYSDDCREQSSITGQTISQAVGTIDYVPYIQEFKKLPNIYLMYNACIYNGKFAHDTITYDLSGMTENEDVNIFVVATAKDYTTDFTLANSTVGATLKDTTNGELLYRTLDSASRDDVVVSFADAPIGKEALLHVYHNLQDTNLGIVDTSIGMHAQYNVGRLDVGNLNDAQNNRGLYKVKIWMQEGDPDDVDTVNIDPVLQGTRGGDEIE